MQNKYSREDFKSMMFKYGYTFDKEHKYISKDGTIILKDNHIVVYNNVLHQEEQIYVKLSYPFLFEDSNIISGKYDDDFRYHHSYQTYKDYMNLDNKDYKQEFMTEIYRYYYKQEEDNT